MFGPEVNAAARAHALAEFPREACGLVIDGKYHPFRNVRYNPNDVCTDPYSYFELPRDAWPVDGRIVQAVIHSHCSPNSHQHPSAADMRSMLDTGVPWGIVHASSDHCTDPLWFGEHILDEPLSDENGRHIPKEFVHGVRDCYTIIRKYYWQVRGVKIPEFPRDNEWWGFGGDLYADGFAKAGFHRITPDQVKTGDVVLLKIKSKVINHGGVVLDNGLFLHHLQNRLSATQPIGRWLQLNPTWLRYGD